MKSSENESYEKDFYKWTKSQSKLLAIGDFKNLDIDNLVEEIECLGKSHKRILHISLIILLTHLLKQKYHPNSDCDSLRTFITTSKHYLKSILEDSPSLLQEINDRFEQSYEDAKEDASYETKISIQDFPEKCPWTLDDLISNPS